MLMAFFSASDPRRFYELTTQSLGASTEELVRKVNAHGAFRVDDRSFDLWYLQLNHHVRPREAQIRVAVCWIPAVAVHMDLKDRDSRMKFHAFAAQ